MDIAGTTFSSQPSADSQALLSVDVMDVNGAEEGAEDEYWTIAELLSELTRTYLDELASPKLLPERVDLVDKLLQQVNEMEEIMVTNNNKSNLSYSAHRMELRRIEYLTNSYLRVRLRKIERNVPQILHEHSERIKRALAEYRAGREMERPELLDSRELDFAEKLFKANSALFSDSFLKHIPASLQWLPISRGTISDLTRVFVQVLRDGLDDVPVPNMEDPNSDLLISLEKGTQLLLPFNCIQELLERGDVCLL